jgi:tryptophan synthase alpha chain
MSRITETFARCREQGRAALVTFVTGGDPTPADTSAVLDALVAGGADVI